MRSLLGRFHRPNARSQSEQLFMLNSLGDGSTLSLDFTTGVLDPRLTFTRSTNATFINSQGYVEWAASNHAPRTNWNFTSPTGSGWNAATTSGTGTFQWVGDGTVIASSGSSGQALTSVTTSTGIAEGLRYVMSVTAQSVTGSPTIQSIFDFTSASGNNYFKNGATATAGTTVASGDRISVSAVASSTVMNFRIGCGAWFANRTNESVTLTQFHWHPGSSPVPYYENTATSPRYNSARFDYDPTTLTARGLLIEGSATNILTSSDELLVASGWGEQDILSRTTGTSPSNGTAVGFYPTTASGYHRVLSPYQSGLAAGAYTTSIWFKRLNSNYRAGINANNVLNASVIFDLNGAGSVVTLAGTASNKAATITAYPNDWYRCTLTGTKNIDSAIYYFMALSTSTDSTGDAFVGVASQGMLMWGAQLETGSGASSYIPTGASTGTRAQDLVSITSTDFSSWWTSSNPLSMFFDISATSKAITAGVFRVADASGSAYGYQAYWNGTSFPIQLRATISGTVNSDVGLGTVASNTRTKFAYTINSAAVKRFKDGSLVNTVSSPTLPPDPMARFYFGGNPAFGGASGDFYLRGFKYWPTVLSDAQIQSLTT